MNLTAWDLDTPRDEQPWRGQARCGAPGVDPNWWHAESQAKRGRAIHECLRHCPVRSECALEAERHPQYVAGTVRAGVYYVGTIAKPRPSGAQPKEWPCPGCAVRSGDPALMASAYRFASGLRPHGTLAAVRRHQYYSQPLCEECLAVEAERVRQRRARERDERRSSA